MKRSEAVVAIYRVINSGILDEELEDELTAAAASIEYDEWEED